MTILVADDDSVVRMTMRTLLTAEGHTVITAIDGEEALAKLADIHVDLIVTDIYMPGIDGLRLRNMVRTLPNLAQTPIIFVSGYDDKAAMESVCNPKLEGFYKKGASAQQLIAWINWLSTPPERRVSTPPSVKAAVMGKDSRARGGNAATRVPII